MYAPEDLRGLRFLCLSDFGVPWLHGILVTSVAVIEKINLQDQGFILTHSSSVQYNMMH